MRFILLFLWAFVFLSCKKTKTIDDGNPLIIEPFPARILEIKAIDGSFIPEVRQAGIIAKNENDVAEDMLTTLKKNGVNTIRIRLWKNPSNIHSSFNEVKTFAKEVKNAGMKVWLCVHYSDTWADPGSQQKPAQWTAANFVQLKDSVYQYTKKVVAEINADYIQIGNEINNGFLWPEGKSNNTNQFVELIKQGIKAVRDNSPTTKIILHYAGHENAVSFFAQFATVDYDIIGLSYYPFWHGKSMDMLQSNINLLGLQYNKNIVIAETAYPFTFGFNDFTNNIIGSNNQILTEYTATPDGQISFLLRLKAIVTAAPKGIGFCYWGADWVSMYGATATNGSSWENQALWDFTNKILPSINVFKD